MSKEQKKKTMTKGCKDWGKFIKRLEKGVNFREVKGETVWSCNSLPSMPKTTRILEEMGYDVASSEEYLRNRGGACDCEVIFNGK